MELWQPGALLTTALFAYALGGVFSFVCYRHHTLARVAGFGMATLGSAAGLLAAILSLSGKSPAALLHVVSSGSPILAIQLRLDPLAAFFLLVLSSVGIALSIYSIAYARSYEKHGKPAVLAGLYNLLLLFTALVFTASHGGFFLLAWEMMALAAYLLVTFEHRDAEARRAGVLYFAMSHIGTGCLILGFVLLAQFGFAFEDLRAGAVAIEGTQRRDLIFVLFVIGFGIKAGIIPLHIWLPEAHPVAPSNISALLSGVLIKAGIYGIARVSFDLLGTPENWWGIALLVIGTVSAVIGVLYALMEHDLKRLLAYHSIENIGIILMGLGASLTFLRHGQANLAALALAAGLFHTLNHAVFKALLFLGAGAVLSSTGTRNMELLGGLVRRMPATSFMFLVGAVAISALPPLNGFVSEWLTYQSLLQGFGSTASLQRLIFPLSGAMLALTGALAAACFVKAFGITFLGQARSAAAREAKEADPAMVAGMSILAATCFVLGLCPALLLRLLEPVTMAYTGIPIAERICSQGGWILGTGQAQGGTVSTLGLAAAGLCLLSIPAVVLFLTRRGRVIRSGPTWDCGLRGLTPMMQYTATGFSKPIRMIFKALFRPHRQMQREYDYSPYFATTLKFESHIEEPFVTRLYKPLERAVLRFSRRMRAVQAGSMQAYLIYLFVTLLLLLIFAR